MGRDIDTLKRTNMELQNKLQTAQSMLEVSNQKSIAAASRLDQARMS